MPVSPHFSGRSASEVRVYSLARDGNVQLSPNFRLVEFACRCPRNEAETTVVGGVAYYDEVRVHPALVILLQAARDFFGRALRITSGYRPAWYNAGVTDAAADSNHVSGLAADVVMIGDPAELASFVRDALGAGGTGVEDDGHVHVSVRDEGGEDRTLTGGRYRWFAAVYGPSDAVPVLMALGATGALGDGYELGGVTINVPRRATAALAAALPLWLGVGLAAGALVSVLRERP